MREERAEVEAKLEKQRLDAEAQRKEAEAKLEAQRKEADAKLKQQREDHTHETRRLTNDQQIAALQTRLEALHAAKLLADEELFALEDAIADADEAVDGDDRAARMVALSARMASDASFSRQLRRKFLN